MRVLFHLSDLIIFLNNRKSKTTQMAPTELPLMNCVLTNQWIKPTTNRKKVEKLFPDFLIYTFLFNKKQNVTEDWLFRSSLPHINPEK